MQQITDCVMRNKVKVKVSGVHGDGLTSPQPHVEDGNVRRSG